MTLLIQTFGRQRKEAESEDRFKKGILACKKLFARHSAISAVRKNCSVPIMIVLLSYDY